MSTHEEQREELDMAEATYDTEAEEELVGQAAGSEKMAPKTQQQVMDTLTASISLNLMPMSTHSGEISQEISVRWKP